MTNRYPGKWVLKPPKTSPGRDPSAKHRPLPKSPPLAWGDASGPPAEVWARNPSLYIRECLEVGVHNYIWDAYYAGKRGISPGEFVGLWCHTSPWRYVVVDDMQGEAIEYRHDDTKIVHYIWRYGDPISELEDILQEIESTDSMAIIMRLPRINDPTAKNTVLLLNELQRDYPDSKIHMHALYSYAIMFGLDWRSVDIDARTPAARGLLCLPNGRSINRLDAARCPEWISVTGMHGKDMDVPRNRCMFNLRSALWAASNYKKQPKFATRFVPRGPYASPKVSKRIFFRNAKPAEGDMIACSTCSLANNCRYYREGAICAVPESDVSDLAGYFNTRNADAIIEGLGELLASQMERLQLGMNAEADEENFRLDPAVSKLFDSIFRDGERLAKLINPSLARPSLQVNLGSMGGGASVPLTEGNVKPALIASIVGELEALGHARSDITPEMVEELLQRKASMALPKHLPD